MRDAGGLVERLASIDRAIDELIDSVADHTIKPDRTWAVAMHALFKRRDALQCALSKGTDHE